MLSKINIKESCYALKFSIFYFSIKISIFKFGEDARYAKPNYAAIYKPN